LDAAWNRRFSGPLKAERVGEEKTSFRNKTQILMGDWCRKADTEKPKETSAKVGMFVDSAVVPVRRNQFPYTGDVFALDRGLLMGDLLPSTLFFR